MNDIQLEFFDQIKRQTKDQSLAQVIAELLSITVDGAYRRIRNDTPLKLYEAVILAKEYNLSLDALIGQTAPDVFTFRKAGLGQSNLDFKAYLSNMYDLLTMIQSRGVKKAIFACKDIPVFHLFEFPELTLFKMFFWQNTIFNVESLKGQKFSLGNQSEYLDECLSLARRVAERYSMIPTTEIWNEETSFSFM